MNYSVYCPTVTVWDDGHMQVEWTDSYQETVVDANVRRCDVLPARDAAEEHHTKLIDSLVAGRVSSEGLRRLANWIDRCQELQGVKRRPTGTEKHELDAIIARTAD